MGWHGRTVSTGGWLWRLGARKRQHSRSTARAAAPPPGAEGCSHGESSTGGDSISGACSSVGTRLISFGARRPRSAYTT
eukprot:CAMPEP_0198424630 /NCGR_PEP_ID=MMETSP1452-20131203/3993_1 /TAXON_ID=1181717 /ORGANISM="Synchroma pusillum, Strain CCMP3072" /LENGTH=78 /DNA_ID=CAMNT_0044144977 /DNA_START=103 /DNA_END=336 /DNA_ORIENTATION=+